MRTAFFLSLMFLPCVGLKVQAGDAAPSFTPCVVIIVNRFGLYPDKFSMPKGPFVLFVENRLLNKGETYQVSPMEATSAPLPLPLTTKEGSPRAYELLDLAPGQYQLKFKGNTQLSVQFTINGQ